MESRDRNIDSNTSNENDPSLDDTDRLNDPGRSSGSDGMKGDRGRTSNIESDLDSQDSSSESRDVERSSWSREH